MSDSDGGYNGENSIILKHRKEKKDLQAKIQALKKSASKGDKKKRKEVLEEIAQLEIDLEQKHAKEVCESKEENGKVNEEVDVTEQNLKNNSESKLKVSKAQKRRDKKAQELKQKEEEFAAESENYKNAPRKVETRLLNGILKNRGLCLYLIASDGNCLYNAIKHQLEITNRIIHDITHLRKETANYILNNKDSLICYMTNTETGNLLSDDEFINYCEAVRSTPAWGGQVEIKALSYILKAPIEVIQGSGPSTIQGDDEFSGPNIIITYHRHMYSLGEHYNSTRPLIEGEIIRSSDDEDNIE